MTDKQGEYKKQNGILNKAAGDVVNVFKENKDELKQALGSSRLKELEKTVDKLYDIGKYDELVKDRKMSDQMGIDNKKALVGSVIKDVNDTLDKFEKSVEKQENKSKLDKVKDVMKAAANVVKTMGSKGAKLELAAAQFAITGSAKKLNEFKERKSDISQKLTTEKEKVTNVGKGNVGAKKKSGGVGGLGV